MKIEEAIKQKKFKSEEERLIINLVYTSNWLANEQMGLFKRYGISAQQYNVLRILRGQSPNAASVGLIQERMLDRMSNASRLVEKLKQKELVKRNECPKDRRQVDVMITPKGMDLLTEIDGCENEMNSVTNGLVLDEKKLLNQLLDKLRTNKNNN
ncbi:MAG: MarR family transcriptional regulator [Bacteroidetes bacterium]|nr:MAG: MarR family transcriptional regulator [Bacteroidota bacterium]